MKFSNCFSNVFNLTNCGCTLLVEGLVLFGDVRAEQFFEASSTSLHLYVVYEVFLVRMNKLHNKTSYSKNTTKHSATATETLNITITFTLNTIYLFTESLRGCHGAPTPPYIPHQKNKYGNKYTKYIRKKLTPRQHDRHSIR